MLLYVCVGSDYRSVYPLYLYYQTTSQDVTNDNIALAIFANLWTGLEKPGSIQGKSDAVVCHPIE